MANYKPDLSCQNKFIPINFAEQILPGTFEYALCYIVENKLDLSGFDAWYNNDKTGAAAYPPSVMLKIILLGYAHGLISSRRIAKACETNILFMSVSGTSSRITHQSRVSWPKCMNRLSHYLRKY